MTTLMIPAMLSATNDEFTALKDVAQLQILGEEVSGSGFAATLGIWGMRTAIGKNNSNDGMATLQGISAKDPAIVCLSPHNPE